MKKVLVGVCLVLALLVSIVLLARRSRIGRRASLPQDASLLLLGTTNLPTGTFTLFCLTNGTRMDIAFVPEGIEQASAGAWLRIPLTGRTAIGRDWIGVPEELQPGQSGTFMVPPPNTDKIWRLILMCQERARLVDPVTDTLRHLTDTNAMQNQGRQFTGRRYYTTSPAVTNEVPSAVR